MLSRAMCRLFVLVVDPRWSSSGGMRIDRGARLIATNLRSSQVDGINGEKSKPLDKRQLSCLRED